MAFKYILPVFFLMIFSATSQAQITINSSHMASAGDTLRFSNAGIVAGNTLVKTGTQYHWDFRGVQPVSQGVDEFKQSWQTPYILSFGFTAIGLKIADTLGVPPAQTTNVYQFFRNRSTRWEGVGLGFVFQSFPLPQAGKHTNPETLYQFPMTYNDNFTDSFEVSLALKAGPITAGTYFQRGRRTTEVDGYGWISTPYKDSMPCIRLKSVIRQSDSVSVVTPKVNFAFPNNRVEYEWWTTTEAIPVMKAIGTEVGSTFIPNTVRYRDRYRNTGQSFFNVDFTASDLNPEVGDTVTFKNTSVGFFSDYLWNITPKSFKFVNGSVFTDEEIDVQFSGEGSYTISLQAENAFIDPLTEEKKDYVTVSKSTNAINEEELETIVIPNPVQGNFQMDLSQLNGGPVYVEIINSNGAVIESIQVTDPRTLDVETSHWPNGVIYIKLTANQTNTTFKLIKQ
jgi:plastocyanin